jgi:hypothetical protein
VPENETSGPERLHVHRVLDLYRHHPHTTGRVRKPDRLLAQDLYRQGISVANVTNALLLVAARRSHSPQHPLSPIRSLHYFLPAIKEVRDKPLDEPYLRYLRQLNKNDGAARDPRVS